MRHRILFFFGILAIAYASLLFKLYDIQIAKSAYYRARAGAQLAAGGAFRPERGTIYFTDREGTSLPAATNKYFPRIFAVPKSIDDMMETANRLASLLGVSREEIEEKLEHAGSEYRLLQKKTDPALSKLVQDANIQGVFVDDMLGRFYPSGPRAAHLLGFVGPASEGEEEIGHYGIEKFYEERLAGGDVTKDIFLTIDPTIQMEAEQILGDLVRTYHGRGGSVIVAEPKTGKILAMGSVPTFDPNVYFESPIGNFVNPAVQKIYEPGSVFKVITMAAAIDAGKITPDTTFHDMGSLTVSGKTIKNWDLKAHGTVTMTNVLEQSINTGAAFAARMAGDRVFGSYLGQFGFGEKTGIDLPGEVAGDLKRLTPKAPAIAFATASFGQGVAVTPLELIQAVAAIANGGVLMRPYVNAELGPEMVRRVITSETAHAVINMMIAALDKAEVAKISGYSLAGKTGTAQVPDFKKGGYTDTVINTYVGFGPTSDPRFIILIKLDQPEGAPLAGMTVVPAFRDLAQFILNYYQIPPDRL